MADEEKKPVEEPRAGAEEAKPRAKRKKAKSAGGKGKKDGGMMTKVVATVFGAVVAPILVAVGINYFKNVTTPDKHDATQPGTPVVTTKRSDEPIVQLVSSNLNDHFYVWQPPGADGKGKKEEVDPEQFRYEDNPPRIVFLNKKYGVLTTREEYGNYTLHLQFRWRENQVGAYAGSPRRAGLGLHNTGPDGEFELGRYSEGVSVLLGEGETGTVTLAAPPERLQCLCRVKEGAEGLGSAALVTAAMLSLGAQGQAMGTGPLPFLLGLADPVVRTRGVRWNDIRREYVDKGVKEVPVVTGDPKNWDLRIYRADFPWYASRALGGLFRAFGPGWNPGGDAKLPVLPPPSERGYGPLQWNKLQVECNQDAITVWVGDNRERKTVMKLTEIKLANHPLTKGRIAISINGSEMEVRRMDVHRMDAEARQPDKGPEKKGRP